MLYIRYVYQQAEYKMFKRIQITKPLLDLKVSSWEISNFIGGFFLAKLCALKLIQSGSQETVKSLCSHIIEFGSPVLILIACAIFQIYFSMNKIKSAQDFETNKALKRTVEVRESLIYSLFCFGIGFTFYLGVVIFLSMYLNEVSQFKTVVIGLLPFEFTLSVCMCLIWGNIIKFTTHYKI